MGFSPTPRRRKDTFAGVDAFLQVALDLIQPLAMRAFQPCQTCEIPDGKQEA